MIEGMTGGGGLALPSVTRMLTGIVITLALAFGGIVAMKRVLLRTDGRWAFHGIKVVGRASLGSSVRAHLLEVGASRVLVVEGRSGIGLTVLPPGSQEQPHEAAK